jgi:8-hydroxy-5-deazaflavin:NADPH oxidoreductase
MIAFIGGTGPEGLGLALRLAVAGEEVVIGSRKLERAEAAAAWVRERRPSARVRGALNREAVAGADIVFVTVPYDGHRSVLSELAGPLERKVVVDAVVPVAFEKGLARALSVEDGSAAQEAQGLLPRSRLVAAFHTLSARKLQEGDTVIEGDILVCGDDPEAKATAMALAEKIPGLRAVDGGGLANARYVEQITVLLLNLNRVHKAETGIRIVGLKGRRASRSSS